MSSELSNEVVFLQGEKYFTTLLLDISQARKRIDLETYIFEKDGLAMRIISALIKAAERGVKVRILVDGAGTAGWPLNVVQKLEAISIETRFYHPFPWRFWQWRRAIIHLPLLPKMLYSIYHMNRRNHRKTCVIDQEIAYVGSANISQSHLNVVHGGKGWRDTVVRLVGVDITDLSNAFESAWNHMTFHERLQTMFEPINTHAVIRLNYTRHLRRGFYKNLLRRMSKCKTRVWITNAYFVPDNILLKKLKDLAEAGVDVRILLPHKADVFFMSWASSTFYESLLNSGVRIFEYIPSMLHAKSLILDDWFVVGSSNLNHRSLLHDLEADVTITDPQNKKMIEQQFIIDLSQSKEIDLQNWHKRTWFQKFIGRLALYAKYWI